MILFICLRNKTNKPIKQNRNRLLDTENNVVTMRKQGSGGWAKQAKGIKRYKLPVLE